MRTVKVILAVVVFLLATNLVFAQDRRVNNREAQVVFLVNMDCHACEQKVKKNIPYQRGVRNLTTDLGKQLVSITYRTNRTDKDKLKKSIEKLGFTCKEAPKPE